MSKIKVQTPFGQKKKKEMTLYKADDLSALSIHYDRLEVILNHVTKQPVIFKKIREIFNHFKSLDLTLDRVCALEPLTVTELFEIKNFAIQLKHLSELIQKNHLEDEAFAVYSLDALEAVLDPDHLGINSFYLYDSYSTKLKVIRTELKVLETAILSDKKAKRLQLSTELGLKIRPNDELMVEKHKEDLIVELELNDELVYVSDTLMHRTFRIKPQESTQIKLQRISDLKAEETEEEYEIRVELTKKINNMIEDIWCNIEGIAYLDLMIAKAYFAHAFKMTRPVLSGHTTLEIEEGIHLKVKEHLDGEHLEFMPITVNLSHGMSCITGANMGGKTICLRLIGQMQTMAQYGLFVPCKKFVFKPMNFIFLSSQDAQSIDKGLSTFGAEMVNVAEVLPKAIDKGLILVDELARGTNPKEGFAISKAIINYLKTKPSISVITTHFDGLADEKDVLHLQVKGLSEVDFEDLEINIQSGSLEVIHQLMDYRLKIIDTPEAVPKDAIKISKMMGIQEEILEDAKNILEHKEDQ